MSERRRLPNRRGSSQLAFECNGLKYVASVSFDPDGNLAEIFIANSKAASHSDAAARTQPSFARSRCNSACRSTSSVTRCCAMHVVSLPHRSALPSIRSVRSHERQAAATLRYLRRDAMREYVLLQGMP